MFTRRRTSRAKIGAGGEDGGYIAQIENLKGQIGNLCGDVVSFFAALSGGMRNPYDIGGTGVSLSESRFGCCR